MQDNENDDSLPAPAPDTVARIVYASQANIPGPIYAEMERIRACALRHNEPQGIHTALLHQCGWFVQWKEGPSGRLRELMARVANDPRHHSMRIVHASRGPRLLHGPWSMAIVQCADTPEEMAHRVALLKRSMDAGRPYSPPAVWRQLSTPLQHPGAAQQAHPDAFQRVLACSARGMAAFELVRWLAHRSGQEVVHRRFAGAQDLDVGTDYVDFTAGGQPMRVIAMARRGLALPLTRAFLPDYSHVLLLLSGDAQADLALVRRVAQACADLPAPPMLVGVAPLEPVHSPLAALVRGLGLRYEGVRADSEACIATWAAVQPLLPFWREAANSGSAMPLDRVLSG